ncbi:hypothetical protein IV203_028377 [Nitzschia inconspicua]|uniref:C2H2-type domain-containing protein n=1 Tax=Nitzschia inconspicua TaxID=303405 RepID=A0A9K3LNZ6_9STRA|nr:hypothetical protein IV203_028377 [Nitzschia inconspicua]
MEEEINFFEHFVEYCHHVGFKSVWNIFLEKLEVPEEADVDEFIQRITGQSNCQGDADLFEAVDEYLQIDEFQSIAASAMMELIVNYFEDIWVAKGEPDKIIRKLPKRTKESFLSEINKQRRSKSSTQNQEKSRSKGKTGPTNAQPIHAIIKRTKTERTDEKIPATAVTRDSTAADPISTPQNTCKLCMQAFGNDVHFREHWKQNHCFIRLPTCKVKSRGVRYKEKFDELVEGKLDRAWDSTLSDPPLRKPSRKLNIKTFEERINRSNEKDKALYGLLKSYVCFSRDDEEKILLQLFFNYINALLKHEGKERNTLSCAELTAEPLETAITELEKSGQTALPKGFSIVSSAFPLPAEKSNKELNEVRGTSIVSLACSPPTEEANQELNAMREQLDAMRELHSAMRLHLIQYLGKEVDTNMSTLDLLQELNAMRMHLIQHLGTEVDLTMSTLELLKMALKTNQGG